MALGLASCSALPSEGPLASEVKTQAAAPADAKIGEYVLVDLTPRTIEVLGSSSRDSFISKFGTGDPAPSQVIGVGDSLQIIVWEAAAGGLFSSVSGNTASTGANSATVPPQVVARDGTILMPFVGRIRVVGTTPIEVEKRITEALKGKAIDPQVLVAINGNSSNTASVFGEVTTGAKISLNPHGTRILDAVALAGGLRSPVYDTVITLVRGNRSVTVPMPALYSDPRENIYVRPNDTLTLERVPQTFTAFGATGRNAQIPFDAQTVSLEEAIAKAGGLLDSSADASGVFVMRSEPVEIARAMNPALRLPPGQTMCNVIYHLNLRNAADYFLARQFMVRNKDIVYVASAPSNQLQKFLVLLQPATAAARSAQLVYTTN